MFSPFLGNHIVHFITCFSSGGAVMNFLHLKGIIEGTLSSFLQFKDTVEESFPHFLQWQTP